MLRGYLGILVAWAIMLPQHVLAQPTSMTIDGEFEGCEFDRVYPLVGGGILICQEYNYEYDFAPTVIIVDTSHVVIGKRLYSASVVPGKLIKTRVNGAFDGCDFDKIVALLNGLLFQCRMYHYHYAYQPEVKIFVFKSSFKVYIDGEEYQGTFLKR